MRIAECKMLNGEMTILAVLLLLPAFAPGAFAAEPVFPRGAQPAGYSFREGMSDAEIRQTVDSAAADGVSALDADLGVADDYGLFMAPDGMLAVAGRVVNYTRMAHPQMRVFFYMATLEKISRNVDMDGNGEVDAGKKSLFTEHPEWVQRYADGKPAVHYGPVDFRVENGAEQAFVSPCHTAYRDRFLSLARSLAALGADGLLLDVPYFDDRDGWTSYDDACSGQYRTAKGSEPPKTADWNSTAWKDWIAWRFQAVGDFIGNVAYAARSVKPDITVLVEESTFREEGAAARRGASPSMLAAKADGVVHEMGHHRGSGGASRYTYYDWLHQTALFLAVRAIDGPAATWLLSYPSGKEDATLLSAAVLASGASYWDTADPVMVDKTTDRTLRRAVFNWSGALGRDYFGAAPVASTGLYYSREAVETGDGSGLREFSGVAMMLLASGKPFRVVTSTSNLSGVRLLLVPGVTEIPEAEGSGLKGAVDGGTALLATGPTSLNALFGDVLSNGTGARASRYGRGTVIHTGWGAGREYYGAASPGGTPDGSAAEALAMRFRTLLASTEEWLNLTPEVRLEAPAGIALLPAVDESGSLAVHLLNFAGVAPGKPVPTVSSGRLVVTTPPGTRYTTAWSREFLGGAGDPGAWYPDATTVVVNFTVERAGLILLQAHRPEGGLNLSVGADMEPMADGFRFTVLVTSDGLPVPGALVNITPAGNATTGPVTLTADGLGRAGGFVGTNWSLAEAYRFDISAWAPGFRLWSGTMTGRRSASMVAEMNVSLTAERNTVPAGGAVNLTVRTNSSAGPLAGVAVNATAGPYGNITLLNATTDANGTLRLRLAVPRDAAGANLTVTVTARAAGYGQGSATVVVRVVPPVKDEARIRAAERDLLALQAVAALGVLLMGAFYIFRKKKRE